MLKIDRTDWSQRQRKTTILRMIAGLEHQDSGD